MKSPWNFSKFELLIYFQLYKAANFYKIPQEIWLTLSRFTGRQEKKDALLRRKNGMQQVEKALQEDVEMNKLAKFEKSKIYCELLL